jgi:hypothetical protein
LAKSGVVIVGVDVANVKKLDVGKYRPIRGVPVKAYDEQLFLTVRRVSIIIIDRKSKCRIQENGCCIIMPNELYCMMILFDNKKSIYIAF